MVKSMPASVEKYKNIARMYSCVVKLTVWYKQLLGLKREESVLHGKWQPKSRMNTHSTISQMFTLRTVIVFVNIVCIAI
jgi:hypothetical protein